MLKILSNLKLKKSFLNEIDNSILESTLITLKSDINSSMKTNNSFPSYRKKHKNDIFSLISHFDINENYISIPNIERIRYLNTRKEFSDKIKTLHIYKQRNQWYISMLISKKIEKQKPSKNKKIIGIDVGLKEFAFLSSGQKIPNPRFYRKLEEKLIWEQKKLNRKKYQSNAWYKQREKVQKIHHKIHNSRMNFLHKLTTLIVSNYDIIGVEKLSIRSMVKNKRLSKSILDASWGTFIELLKYKAKENDKELIEVSRFYPSSQLCSNCGNKQLMPVHLRTYMCKNCNTEIDRDYNASKNIEKKAEGIFLKTLK